VDATHTFRTPVETRHLKRTFHLNSAYVASGADGESVRGGRWRIWSLDEVARFAPSAGAGTQGVGRLQ